MGSWSLVGQELHSQPPMLPCFPPPAPTLSLRNKRDSKINNVKRGGDDKEYLKNYLCPHFGALHGKQKPFFLINV